MCRRHMKVHSMTELERIPPFLRPCSATAILRLWPEAQFAAGPPRTALLRCRVAAPHLARGFRKNRGRDEKGEIKANHRFERIELSRADALAMADRGELGALGARSESSKFKLDIIQNIPESETITIYRNGDFTDLCAGPHVMRTGNIALPPNERGQRLLQRRRKE
jgi:threonyl-tRNA synthetase